MAERQGSNLWGEIWCLSLLHMSALLCRQLKQAMQSSSSTQDIAAGLCNVAEEHPALGATDAFQYLYQSVSRHRLSLLSGKYSAITALLPMKCPGVHTNGSDARAPRPTSAERVCVYVTSACRQLVSADGPRHRQAARVSPSRASQQPGAAILPRVARPGSPGRIRSPGTAHRLSKRPP
jgi:hypothetical protein